MVKLIKELNSTDKNKLPTFIPEKKVGEHSNLNDISDYLRNKNTNSLSRKKKN